MAQLKVRGRLEPINIANDKAIKLKAMYMKARTATEMGARIETQSWIGKLSDVVGVEVDPDRQGEPAIIAETQQIRDDWDALSAEEKKSKTALRMDMMRGKITEEEYWEGLGGKKSQTDIAKEVFG